MKKILILCALLLIVGIGAAIVALRPPENLGNPFQVAAPTALSDIIGKPDTFLAADIRTEGRIVRQCPSSGCWFFLADDAGRQVRVELGHLGRKFPQHVGKTAEIEGRLLQNGKDLEIVGNAVRFK